MRVETAVPWILLFFFFSGCLREYSSQQAHFLGQKITYIYFREKKRARNRITEPGNHCPEGIAVCQPPSSSSGQAKTEIRSTFNCGKNLSLAAYKLSTFYAYLMPFFFFFCLFLRKSIRSVILDGYKFKRKARERKRNKVIMDLQDFIMCSLLPSPCYQAQRTYVIRVLEKSVIPGPTSMQCAQYLK